MDLNNLVCSSLLQDFFIVSTLMRFFFYLCFLLFLACSYISYSTVCLLSASGRFSCMLFLL